MHIPRLRGACLGFSGDNQVVSLHVPAADQDGQEHPRYSFDLEYDADQPSTLILRLLELDQDSFICAVQRSISFPANLLADLVDRRRATAEEMAEWQAVPDEDT
jgi:hypothetical protein